MIVALSHDDMRARLAAVRRLTAAYRRGTMILAEYALAVAVLSPVRVDGGGKRWR